MRPDEPLAASCAVLVNNKAFINSNGWPLGLLVSPQPPQSLPTPAITTPPPAWLAVGECCTAAAIHSALFRSAPPPLKHHPNTQYTTPPVLDGAMPAAAMTAAVDGLSQALQQLPPHTNLLLSVCDAAASFFDLSSPRPQSWVLAGAGAPRARDATARALRASGVRPVPLSACGRTLPGVLRALRRAESKSAEGRRGGEDPEAQQAEERRRLSAAAAAIDLSLHLLGRGMAQWDARHKAELAAAHAAAAAAPSLQQSQQPFPAKPMHAARVLFISSSHSDPASAAPGQPPPPDARRAAQMAALFDELGAKAAALDAQLDAVFADAAAPALPYLADAADACGGALLHQPGLAAPLGSNIVALCGRRLGWDAFIDVRTPAGVKVGALVGPLLQPDGPLPASISPVDPQPVLQPPPPQALPAARDGGGGDGGGGTPRQQQQQQAGGGRQPSPPRKPRVARPTVPPTRLSSAAAAAAAIDRGRFYGAALELTADLSADVAQEIQVLWEWTTADGRRVRQVSSTQLQVAERLPDFLAGLDLEAGALLLSRRLVASALSAAGGLSAKSWGRPLPRAALPDGRLAAGLALQLAAQRMGAARVARRGLLGFGGRTVWELPTALVPLAVALYLLQAGPLLNAGAGGGAAAADAWRLRVHQFLHAAPGIGGTLATPCLYVQQPGAAAAADGGGGGNSGSGSGGGGFEPVPPVSLAVGPRSLALLDCGTELLVFSGAALGGGAGAANGGGPLQQQQQQQQQQQAAAAPSPQPPDDLPTAAAPAVQYAHQLTRGRIPVPSIHVLQDGRGVRDFLSRLLPLHMDVLPLQFALLPGLRDLSPHEHADLMEWHRRWGAGGGEDEGGGWGGFGHFCAGASVSLPVEGGLMEVVSDDGE
jgi:hypothetical protein